MADRPRRIEESAGAVIACPDGEEPTYLLIHDSHGNWGFPKGHLEAGESDLDAATREVAEETGLTDTVNLGRLGEWSWEFDDAGVTVVKLCRFFAFLAPTPSAVPRPSEGISAVEWLPVGAAAERVSFSSSREALEAAHEIVSAQLAQGDG